MQCAWVKSISVIVTLCIVVIACSSLTQEPDLDTTIEVRIQPTTIVAASTPTQIPMNTTLLSPNVPRLGDVVTEGEWQVKIISMTRENVLSDWRGNLEVDQGYIWLLLEIQLVKNTLEESMLLSSGDFILLDGQGERFEPIGANTSYGWLITWPWIETEEDIVFQAYYKSECGDECEEFYDYYGQIPEDPRGSSVDQSFASGPRMVQKTKEDTWKVFVLGKRWQQTYVYRIPVNARGLKFMYKDLSAIDLGY